jgi:FkbM family methyltransferase
MKSKVAEYIIKAYRYVFAREIFYKVNRFLHLLSLRGLGVQNYESRYQSGEVNFLRRVLTKMKNPVVFDVGANEGEYAKLVLKFNDEAEIHTFEPQPYTFSRLEKLSRKKGVHTANLALGDRSGRIALYDYDQTGSPHASPVQGVIKKTWKKEEKEFKVNVEKLDNYAKNKNVGKIDLLKIDTEGYEYKVIKGASEFISKGKVSVIQIEFNKMNIESKTFLRDLIDKLADYKIYRLIPNGSVQIKNYRPIEHEIFGFQNIVAVHEECGLDNHV